MPTLPAGSVAPCAPGEMHGAVWPWSLPPGVPGTAASLAVHRNALTLPALWSCLHLLTAFEPRSTWILPMCHVLCPLRPVQSTWLLGLQWKSEVLGSSRWLFNILLQVRSLEAERTGQRGTGTR